MKVSPGGPLNSGRKFKLYIVYNSDVSTDRAVTLAYELGSTDMVQHVALYLRNMIAEAFISQKPATVTNRLLHSAV